MEDFRYIGIDADLENRIYFPTTAEKTEFQNQVQSALIKLSINEGDNRLEVINKIAESNINLAFLREVLAFTDNLQYSRNSEHNNYYTNCKLCEYNLNRKVEYRESDFRNEELLFHSLMSIDILGYARASLNYTMGRTFAKVKSIDKANFYFDVFRKTTFELSPATISDFYKKIAEVYLESNLPDIALNWLKEGLHLNPKLGVKKIIKKLETE